MPEPQIIHIGTPYKGRVTKLSLSDQPEGTVVDSRDFLPFDAKTGRTRLSTRPGWLEHDSGVSTLNYVVGLGILGNADAEDGGIMLMAVVNDDDVGSAAATSLYRYSSGWGLVDSITASVDRTVHMSSYGNVMYVACDDPYKKFTYGGAVATWSASNGGTIPPDCTIVATWGSRMVLLGDPANPDVVNFSRNDDPLDWDTGAEDTGAAVTVSIGEAATCGIPHNHDCFIVGTKHGMWIFKGNPTSGTLEQFEFTVGPINSSAWCKADNGYTYFIAHNGLYRMAPGCGSPPEQVSRNVIPDTLIGLDGVANKAYLVYDERFRCVQIHIQGSSAVSYCYDVDGGGFWKITAPTTNILTAARFGLFDSTTASGSLVGGAGGVYRLDNATAIGGASLAYATMVKSLAPFGQKGLINKAVAVFGSNTTSNCTGTVKIFGGASAELANGQTAERKSTTTIDDLQDNHGIWYPRVGGQSVCVRVDQGTTSEHISIEGIDLYAIPAGVERNG